MKKFAAYLICLIVFFWFGYTCFLIGRDGVAWLYLRITNAGMIIKVGLFLLRNLPSFIGLMVAKKIFESL